MKKKKLYCTAIILFAMVVGCTKKKEQVVNSSPIIIHQDAPGFKIKGLRDVTVRKGVDTTISMHVSADSFKYTYLSTTVTPENLPFGVSATPAEVVVYSSFDTTYVFHIRIEALGTYPITLREQGKNSRNDANGFNIIVVN